jgi:hypothetical protein
VSSTWRAQRRNEEKKKEKSRKLGESFGIGAKPEWGRRLRARHPEDFSAILVAAKKSDRLTSVTNTLE